MKIKLKDIITVLIMFMGSAVYFFFKSAKNTRGLIINSIFELNADQASTFYFVMGCTGVLISVISLAVYLQNKRLNVKSLAK